MASSNFQKTFTQVILPKVYNFGATIVLIGAMFKLLNWPGGALMLGTGLSTEAAIFFLSAFEKPAPEYHWENIHPELLNEPVSAHVVNKNVPQKPNNNNGANLNAIGLSQEQVAQLSSGIQKLILTTEQINKISGSVNASAEFSQNLVSVNEDVMKMKKELNSLTSKIASLSSVYDNMLASLKK